MLRITIASLLIVILLSCGREASRPGVLDEAGLLSKEEKERIGRIQEVLLRDLDIELRTVVLKKRAPDIDLLAVQIFEKEALGSRTKGARGILLLIDPAGEKVRLEIGYDLEPILTDVFVGYIERKQMVPFFTSGKIGPGIEATVELIAAKLLEAINEGDYQPEASPENRPEYLSGGGGAKASLRVNQPLKTPESPNLRDLFGPQPTPLAVLEKYKQVLKLHIKAADLGLYTPETQRFFRQWLVTDAQQENALKSLLKAPPAEVIILGDRAVIRFPVEQREYPPYFLRRDQQGWMLDFATMNRAIQFNHLNQWHFRTLEHPYMFGFKDLIFDDNGFPHKPSR
ncbi:MAG TPA: TPM domain-containing protein [Thermodesulfatator sp.]|nr:TPM domain-containing protein [Thermodesulfatator sp.]